MFDLHLVQDGGSVVGDGDIAVGADEHLVHAFGAQRRPQDVAHAPGCQDVCLIVGERARQRPKRNGEGICTATGRGFAR